jgi:hypothetical protein
VEKLTSLQAKTIDQQGRLGVKDAWVAKDRDMARSTGRMAAARMPGLAALILAATAPAFAQVIAPAGAANANHLEVLATSLVNDIPCASPNVRDALDDRARKSGASSADLGAALAIISSSSDVCAPVRMAASASSTDLAARQTAAIQAAAPVDPLADPLAETEITPAQRVTAAAVDAEARAASTRFTNGPPPRNLTRGRITGL